MGEEGILMCFAFFSDTKVGMHRTSGSFTSQIAMQYRTFRTLNAIIILGKYFIYGCKLKENIPILPNFLRRIKSELEVEKEMANNLNKIEKFLDKWGEFWTSLRNITV